MSEADELLGILSALKVNAKGKAASQITGMMRLVERMEMREQLALDLMEGAYERGRAAGYAAGLEARDGEYHDDGADVVGPDALPEHRG